MLVTAVLLTYNCEKFVAQALQSALAQRCDPMQIIVSDDASSDRTFQILQHEIGRYAGPHRVELRRRDSNSGSKSAHLNDVLRVTSGDIIVFFDGDDVSDDTRVQKLTEAFSGPEVFAVYSAHSLIDESGRAIGHGNVPYPDAATDSKVWFASIGAYASGGTLAIRREVFECFGELDTVLHEDVVLPFRASLLGKVGYLHEELVAARRHRSLTQSFDDFSTMESYRIRHLAGIEQAERKMRSRLDDVSKAKQLMPGRSNEFCQLRQVVSASVADAQASAGLVSPRFRTRARALLSMMRSPTYRDSVPRDVFLTLMPNTYLRYKRFRFRKMR